MAIDQDPVDADAPAGRRLPTGLSVALALLVLFGVAYLGTAAWAGTRAARGTTVAGVDVGGLDRTTTQQRLSRAFAERAKQPLTVTAGQGTAQVVPADAGLGVDSRATAARLVGFSLKPTRLWEHLAGAGPVEPVTTRDDASLTMAVTQLADQLDQVGADGAIRFTASGAQLVEGAQGRRLEQDAAADVLARHWVDGPRLRLPARLDEPPVAPGELRRAFEEFAKPATSGPLTVVVGKRSVKVPVATFAPTLSLTARSGRLVPAVDGAALRQALLTLDPQLEPAPRDATIDVENGRVVTTASRAGIRIEPQQLAADVLPALTAPSRSVTVKVRVQPPQVSSDDLEQLGIVEQVSTFTTQFPHNPPRTANIRLAAKTLDGTIVKPGETFSLNAALGQRTKEKGYQQAPVINGGRLTQDYGGGISQVSTTLFNAVFFAGLDSVTHKPHSFYISRYPEGREATISWPTVDQKFRNDSGHGILIKTRVTDSAVTVSFYGTKVWDITALKSPRTNVKQPRTIHDTDGECVPQSPSVGFDVTVTRVFSRDGAQVRTEKFFTRYIPEDHVICG
ncbi:MAG TPA: VanW family protein [Angustibacter sp.]|nr:VanW family protein [Angustibacter sp.]